MSKSGSHCGWNTSETSKRKLCDGIQSKGMWSNHISTKEGISTTHEHEMNVM